MPGVFYFVLVRRQMSHLAERRIRIMTEVLTGIRTIKVNCWETPFTNLVTTVRRYFIIKKSIFKFRICYTTKT